MMNDRNTGDFDASTGPEELATGNTYLSDRQIENTQGLRERCDNGECQNPNPHPMEMIWTELASPVPYGSTLTISYNNPDVERVGNSLAIGIAEAMRPNGIEDHAILMVGSIWQDISAGYLEDLPGSLGTRLVDLAGGWEGDDFDRFLEEIEHTRQTTITMIDDVQRGAAELKATAEAVYTAQGGGTGILYPAASIWKAGSSMVNKSKIHVRPAWRSGGCPRDRDQETVWEYLGLGEDLYDRYDWHVQARASWIMATAESRGETVTEEQALQYAADEYEPVFDGIFVHWSEAQKAASDNHNALIEDRRGYLESAQITPELTVEPVRPASVADPDDLDFGDPELKPPPFPETMPYPQIDDFIPPAPRESDFDIPPPDRPWDGPPPAYDVAPPSTVPSTGGGIPQGGGAPHGGGSPWSSVDFDDDDLSGGLASGGLGGGASPGLTGAPSTGAGGSSGGTGTPAVPMGGGARGAGAGSGRGGRGGMMGGGGGGRGGDEDGDRDTWLTEDEDVWGIVSEDDDPYA